MTDASSNQERVYIALCHKLIFTIATIRDKTGEYLFSDTYYPLSIPAMQNRFKRSRR